MKIPFFYLHNLPLDGRVCYFSSLVRRRWTNRKGLKWSRTESGKLFFPLNWVIDSLEGGAYELGNLNFFVYEFLGINPPPFFDRTYETISSWIFLTPFTEASISECQMWTKLWNKIFYFGIEFCIEIVRQASEMLYYYLSCFHFTYYLCLFIGS